MPACFFYGVNGRLKFVCRRFVAPAGFSVPKQLSPEDMREREDFEFSWFWFLVFLAFESL